MNEPHADQRGVEERSGAALAPAATGAVLWHLLRISVLWVGFGVAAFWGWLTWGDVDDPWLAWACGVLAMHFAVPAYSVTGLGRRLGRHTMTRGQLSLGWACLLVLTISVTLVVALVLGWTHEGAPPLADLVVSTVFPALVSTACLVTLPRLWHLGAGWGAVVSILLIVITLGLMGLAVWQVMAAPAWLSPVLWAGSAVALIVVSVQLSRVSMENMSSIQGLY